MPFIQPLNRSSESVFLNGDTNSQQLLIKTISFYFNQGFTAFPVQIKLVENQNEELEKKAKFSFKWRHENITHEKAIEKARQPNWNGLAVLTGSQYNLFVLDIDIKKNRNGYNFLKENGITISGDTPRARTQSGGIHYYFAFPEALAGKSTKAFKEYGLDFRGDGGLVFAPPSNLGENKEYIWEVALENGLKEPPKELIQLINRLSKASGNQSKITKSEHGKRALSEVSTKQRETFFELLSRTAAASKGERSEADFAVVAWGIKIGLSKTEIFNQIKHIGKFSEKANIGYLNDYFETTYENALNAAKADLDWKPPSSKIYRELTKGTDHKKHPNYFEDCLEQINTVIKNKDIDGAFDLTPKLGGLSQLQYGKIKARLKAKLKGLSITDFDNAVREQRKLLKNQPQLDKDSDIFKVLEESEVITELFPAQDFKDNKLWYSTETKNGILIINSNGEHFFHKELENEGNYNIRSIPWIFNLQPSTISYYLKDNNSLEDDYEMGKFQALNLFRQIKSYLTEFYYFKDPLQAYLLTVWIMGTYIFTVFRYYPYLHIKAEKRSGKSHLLDMMRRIAFNGQWILSTTAASLFRDIHSNRGALFLDEMEQMREQDREVYGAVMQLLNGGYQQGAFVQRTEKIGDQFKVVKYSSYSPKAFAGINEINDVLRDRTILIKAWRKKKGENVKRFKINNSLEARITGIQQDGFLFGLKYAETFSEYTNRIEKMDELPENLNDRERDIYEPVFTISKAIQYEADRVGEKLELLDNLSQFATVSGDYRKEEDSESNRTAKVVRIISEIIEGKKVKPIGEPISGFGKYYCRDELYQAFMRDYKKDNFTVCNTAIKFVRLVGDTLNLRPKAYMHRPEKKEYLISEQDLKDFKERFLQH